MADKEGRNDNLDYLGRPRVQTVNNEPSMTIQAHKQEADIHYILRNYKKTGQVNLNEAEAMFADISEFEDFGTAMRHARQAETEFLKLPSKVREIFNHDVAEWLDTAHDPEKRNALVEAGVIEGTVAADIPLGTTSVGESGQASGTESTGSEPVTDGATE